MSNEGNELTSGALKKSRGIRELLLNAAMVAFCISLLLHVFGVAISNWVTIGIRGYSDGKSASAPVEMAFMSEAEMLAVIAEAGEQAAPIVEEVASAEASSLRVEETEAASPVLGEGTGPTELGEIGGGGDIATGDGGLGGGSGTGGARFFGVEASGSRFIFVVDVSGSMEGARLERLRAELNMSISELQEGTQFMVIHFASAAQTLGDRSTWTEVSATSKRWARNAIATDMARARDGTIPLPGFQIAFVQRPRADAIYFMTDGEQFPAGTEEELATLNAQFKIPIHCIRFGDGDIEGGAGNPAEQVMRSIAKKSKGTYKFISIK